MQLKLYGILWICIIWSGAFGAVAGSAQKHSSNFFYHRSKTADSDHIILGLIAVEVCPPKLPLNLMCA